MRKALGGPTGDTCHLLDFGSIYYGPSAHRLQIRFVLRLHSQKYNRQFTSVPQPATNRPIEVAANFYNQPSGDPRHDSGHCNGYPSDHRSDGLRKSHPRNTLEAKNPRPPPLGTEHLQLLSRARGDFLYSPRSPVGPYDYGPIAGSGTTICICESGADPSHAVRDRKSVV